VYSDTGLGGRAPTPMILASGGDPVRAWGPSQSSTHNPYLKTLRRSIAGSRPYGVSIGSRDPLRVTLPPLGDTIDKGGAI